MSLLLSPMAKNSSAGFYNGVATQSLRFDRASDPFLNRTATLGNRKTWTFSTWLKRSGFTSAVQYIFGTNLNNNDATSANIHIGSDNMITVAPWANYFVKTNALLRDVGAWYHIVVDFDTTQAGSANADRVNIYINGVDQTLANGGATLSQNSDWAINLNQANTRIGDLYGDANELDGYLAETNFVDGLSLDASYFGETKNGVWIAKTPDVSDYGTNGFRLKFNAAGLNASSGAVANPTNIGDDSSGKNNHFSVSGIAASDCNMPDSPENNFCVTSPIAMGDSSSDQPSHSEGNLKITGTTTAWRHTRGTHAFRNGKWYFEGRVTATSGTQGYAIGICDPALPTNDDINSGTPPHKFYGMQDTTKYNNNSGTGSAFPGTTAGTIIALAIDMDNGKMWASFDGTWYNNNNASTTLDPDNPDFTGITVGTSGDYVTNQVAYNTSSSIVLNYGQDSSFLGDETATSNADGNGHGTFHSAVPTGFLALCTANLPEPTIGPNSDTQANEYFGILTYTGDGENTKNIRSGATGIGGEIDFKPDWVWTKGRIVGNSHLLYDSIRGAGASKGLKANDVAVEGENDNSTYGYLSSFETNGFNVVKGSTTSDSFMNQNNKTLVAWNWNAGGTSTTNDASSTSIGDRDSVFRANTTAGFSIVTYTGSGQTGAGNDDTYAHGLGVVPEVIICKNRQTTDDWLIGITAIPSFNWANDYMHWNEPEEHKTDANRSAFSVAPTDEVFSVGEFLNKANNYVAYLFASVEGYSKISTYKGNSGASGAFVYLGFRPAWVMLKAVSGVTGQYWCIFDNVRDPFNDQASQVLFVNAGDVEGTGGIDIDFLSNGMKMRDTGNNHNSSSGVYIYMAFAEAPFKYANAR